MSDSSRDKRLGSGTKLLDAVQALDHVGKDHRAEYLHDRLMSAIDSICEERQGAVVKPLFTSAQIDIIKDVSFHIVYILHHKPEKSPGFARELWRDYCKQGPVKMVGLAITVIGAIIAAMGFAVVQYHNLQAGGVDAIWSSLTGQPKKEVTLPSKPTLIQATPPFQIPSLPGPPKQ